MRRFMPRACLALCAAPLIATAQPASRPPAGLAWDFSLPTLDGSRFVRLSTLDGPVLVNFWSRDCPPCVTELPRLQAFAGAHPAWTVLLVSTDTPAAATEFARRHGLTLPVLRPGGNVVALMRAAGNRAGALPFTVVARAAHICDGQLGALSAADLRRLEGACGTAAETPGAAPP
ncbi:TlpA family protein disulfide reductase [Achromobacter xylosoxidans]|uniref:TlpA family protein disulfide reductase n=1 Tax=Alcaligenes xylosoxydans xylosoxydans TaxID=85698 RepID=UPI0022B86B66|nr:TlpA disulfide reductase family protein [Achromobacter xylosoxidans]MCZ8394106.1 TlpA disulfide reductase family protein [Achromobacter xylosoxidans]